MIYSPKRGNRMISKVKTKANYRSNQMEILKRKIYEDFVESVIWNYPGLGGFD